MTLQGEVQWAGTAGRAPLLRPTDPALTIRHLLSSLGGSSRPGVSAAGMFHLHPPYLRDLNTFLPSAISPPCPPTQLTALGLGALFQTSFSPGHVPSRSLCRLKVLVSCFLCADLQWPLTAVTVLGSQVTDHATTALLHYQLPQMPDVVVRSFMVSGCTSQDSMQAREDRR